MIEHEKFCLPRPGATEPRIESFTTPRYADDDTHRILSVALTTRCQECGAQVVQG